MLLQVDERSREPGPGERNWTGVRIARRVVSVACSAGLLVEVSLVAAPQSPTPAPAEAVKQLAQEVHDKGWICYGARSEAGDWDLFLCRPDGSERRNITSTAQQSEFSPQFSRDGRRLLYRRIPKAEILDNNRHGEQGELVVANSDGTDPRVVGGVGEYSWASWSPDGKQIASLSIKGVFVIDLETRKVVRRLDRRGFFQQMTWSPDGRWFSGVANSFGASWSVARMNALTGEANAVNTVDCCTPDWFPDSQQIIFSWRPPGQKANNGYGWTQLWRADAEGKTRQLVYGEDGRHVYGGHVSPDGKYLLFTGNMEEDGDPKHSGGPMGLMRLRDGPTIGGESKELRKLHPNTKDGPVLVLPVGWEPCWTFSGIPVCETSPKTGAGSMQSELHGRGWLVFSATNGGGDWDLFTMRPDGSERRALTNTRDFNEAGGRISPDGTRLLYYRMPKAEPVDNNSYGTFELVLANADATAPVVFGNGFAWASWGPDSRQIACLSTKGVQIIDTATRQVVRELPRKGLVEQLVWSPDGKHFVGTANGLGPFWNIGVLDPETGALKAISETERYNCTPDWCPDSAHIVYSRGIIPQQPGRAELWVASTDGSERRRLYAEQDRHIYGACTSPDGKFVIFTRSIEDLGKVPEVQMAVIRWPPEQVDATRVERLDLGSGWEPHWTLKEIAR